MYLTILFKNCGYMYVVTSHFYQTLLLSYTYIPDLGKTNMKCQNNYTMTLIKLISYEDVKQNMFDSFITTNDYCIMHTCNFIIVINQILFWFLTKSFSLVTLIFIYLSSKGDYHRQNC